MRVAILDVGGSVMVVVCCCEGGCLVVRVVRLLVMRREVVGDRSWLMFCCVTFMDWLRMKWREVYT